MKVTKITAFEADDESLWATEMEAIEQNITEGLKKIGLTAEDGYTVRQQKLKTWFKENKSVVRYILNNINKIEF